VAGSADSCCSLDFYGVYLVSVLFRLLFVPQPVIILRLAFPVLRHLKCRAVSFVRPSLTERSARLRRISVLRRTSCQLQATGTFRTESFFFVRTAWQQTHSAMMQRLDLASYEAGGCRKYLEPAFAVVHGAEVPGQSSAGRIS